MKIKFYYDKEKDIENILNTLNSDIFKTKRGLIPKELVNACQNKSKDEARNELQRILNDFQDLILVKELVKVFSDAWKAIEVEYFNLLKIIFSEPPHSKTVGHQSTHPLRLKIEQLKLFSLSSLIFNIFSYNFSINTLTYCSNKSAITPKFSAP